MILADGKLFIIIYLFNLLFTSQIRSCKYDEKFELNNKICIATVLCLAAYAALVCTRTGYKQSARGVPFGFGL